MCFADCGQDDFTNGTHAVRTPPPSAPIIATAPSFQPAIAVAFGPASTVIAHYGAGAPSHQRPVVMPFSRLGLDGSRPYVFIASCPSADVSAT